MDKIQPELISIQEAAGLLGIHPETLRRWDRTGKLQAVKMSDRGDRKYLKSDVLRFLQENKDKTLFEYKGYEIHSYGYGFDFFPDRFGELAKYIVKKNKQVAGFAFAVAGLELFATPHITDKDLEEFAFEKIKEYIDNSAIKHLSEYTFEFLSGSFLEVENPDWWKKYNS